MKRLLFALTLAALLPCAALTRARQQSDSKKPPAQAAAPKREPPKAIPDEVFNRELRDLDGRSFFLSNYRGQVFVINVWATWCGPCRMQIPEMNKLYEQYSRRGVEFVGLSTENPKTDAKAVRELASELKVKYKLGWIDGETAKALLADRPSIPQTFVVAADGRIVMRLVGFMGQGKGEQVLGESIEKALNPAPAQ